ncbi:MAG: ABC transporter ATP-binding protein [Desulfuromonadaceae bacterium]
MIELIDVTKTFNRGAANEYRAVRGITLELAAGESLIIKGPSGSGKTTLLSMIGCMNRPTSGRIRLTGETIARLVDTDASGFVEVTSLPERFLTAIRRRMFGFVFQQFNLIRGITALENVMQPAYPVGRPRRQIQHDATELLASLGVGHRQTALVEHLSGGEQQRVAIARALINKPSVLIADEPTAHLDTVLSREFMAIAAQLKTRGTTLIIASHDPLVYESDLAERTIVVRDGVLVTADGER